MSYLTDEEKAEAIKKWWVDNGTAVIGGLVLGVAGLFGWNWWTDRQDTRAESASELYSMALAQVSAGQDTRASVLASDLTETGRGTPYAAMGWALVADIAVRQRETERAIHALEQARASTPDRGYRQVLTLRLARHLVADDRLDEAETLLADVTGDAFTALRAELRGDIARARGDMQRAREFYLEARAAGNDTEFLRLKIDELSA